MQIYISFLYAQWRFIVMRLKEEEDIINEQSHNDEELAEYKYDISKLFNKFKEAEYDDVVIRKRLSKLIAKAEAEAEDSFSSIFDESFPDFPDFGCDEEVEDDEVYVRLFKLIAEAEAEAEDSFSSIFDESFPEFPDFVCDDEAEDDDVFVFKRLSKLIAEAEAEDSFSSIFDESFPEFPDFVCDDNVFVFKRLSKLIAEAEEDFFSSIFDESPPFEELPSLIWYLRCVFIPITSRAVYIRFIICINIYI